MAYEKIVKNSKLKEFIKYSNKCSSLVSLPDISKWDTNNVIDMWGMFKSRSLLYSIPEALKWNIFSKNNPQFPDIYMEYRKSN